MVGPKYSRRPVIQGWPSVDARGLSLAKSSSHRLSRCRRYCASSCSCCRPCLPRVWSRMHSTSDFRPTFTMPALVVPFQVYVPAGGPSGCASRWHSQKGLSRTQQQVASAGARTLPAKRPAATQRALVGDSQTPRCLADVVHAKVHKANKPDKGWTPPANMLACVNST